MAKRRLVVTDDEATVTTKQHKKPCSDCPWTRVAVAGWLGSMTAEEWASLAHSDAPILCHTLVAPPDSGLSIQCAGAAIYRANVCKSLRGAFWMLKTPPLELKADRDKVFARPAEFLSYHLGIDQKTALVRFQRYQSEKMARLLEEVEDDD
jgi:hypothetical protein